ncbi:MAG: hypothetical protein H7Z71_06880 [Moraxellaceae bacterium]|nr:hypothetical protein [Pseudobdellovibrionaceae bacterium]
MSNRLHTRSSHEIQLRESTPLDSKALNDFFSSIQTEGKLSMKVRRQIDFFSFYHRLGLKFKNYVFESTKQTTGPQPQAGKVFSLLPPEISSEILGTASFLLQNRSLYNRVFKIALACDLRISNKRKAIMNWSKFFLPKIAALQDDEKIDHFITSINLTEQKAINAFLRPRQLHNNLPIYELIQKYNLVSVHGFFPVAHSLVKNIKVRYAKDSDKEALIQYINTKLQDYELVPEAIQNNLASYISDSILYSFSHFLVAKDSHGNIVGCTHPISSGLLQDYFPQKYDQQANNFRQFLKFTSFFHFSRTLTRPFSSTNKEQTLNFRMLHFLFFEHPEVLNSLVHTAFHGSMMNEFILYAYQTSQYDYRPPKGTLHAETPYGLFEIKKPDLPSYQTKIKIVKNIFLDYLWF